MMYDCFHLVLMVTHQCNLRCTYCYTGRKFARSISPEIGRAAIDRAVRSIKPGGVLELGFFGGEPLLEAELLEEFLDYAQQATEAAGLRLRAGLTTNGTVDTDAAWRVLMREGLDLCISHDGLPEVHDHHRRYANGRGSAGQVLETIRRLQRGGRAVRAVTVVRPDNVACLPEGIVWLQDRGLQRVDLTLDVWATWNWFDIVCLEDVLSRVADLWLAGLPECGINWFDEKAARLAGVPLERTARCGFGDGEIAVAPSGSLYPCERLIGEDRFDHPLQIAGHVLEGNDFCRSPAPGRSAPACSSCMIQAQCNTTCRCSNYVRTGDPGRPDALLCLLDRVCFRETARVLRRQPVGRPALSLR